MRLARLGRIYGRFWQSGDFFRFLDYLALQRIALETSTSGIGLIFVGTDLLQALTALQQHVRGLVTLPDMLY